MEGLGTFSSGRKAGDALHGVSSKLRASRGTTGNATRLTFAFVAILAALALCSATASAKLSRKYLFSFGSGSVASITIDQATEDVFVYSPSDEAIFKFNLHGVPVDFTKTGTNEISGVPWGSASESEIAVDESSGLAKGDIYLAYGASNVLIYNEAGEGVGAITEEAGKPWGEACGVAVGSTGEVYVGLYPSDVNKYTPTSAVVSDSNYAGSYAEVESVCNVAIDPAGNLYVDKWSSGPITSYGASQLGAASAKGSVVDEAGTTLTVDPATEGLFVNERDQVSRFGANGKPYKEPLEVFTGSGEHTVSGLGIAVDAASEDVYVGDGEGGVEAFGLPVIFPEVRTTRASNLAAKTATVAGEVAPEGLPIEECYFEYGENTSYGQTVQCAESEAEIGTGNAYVKVHADLTGLTAGVEYHYRLVVANENGSLAGTDASFEFVRPVIASESAGSVTSTSGDLEASVNPKGNLTTYHFEYGANASYGKSTLTYEVSGEAPVAVRWLLQELAPETTYHYRLVAESAAGVSEGPDEAFTTQGLGGPLTLLDGRLWEMVSPQQKYGAGIIPQVFEGDVIQAAEDGSGLVYLSENPVESEPEGNRAPEVTQNLARRLPGGGWSSRTLTTANESSHGLPIGVGTEYKLFSPNLSEADMQPTSLEALAPGVTQRTPYLRNEAACAEHLSSCFTPMLTTEDTAPGAEWDAGPEDVPYSVSFVDASKDTTHVLLAASTALLEGAPEKGLYEWSEGHLELVSVNELNEPVKGQAGGNSELNVRGAISNNGSRVFFCAAEYFGCEFEGALYMRDTETQESVRLDPSESLAREFEIANEEGSRAFFTYRSYDEATFTYSTHLMACEFVEVAGKLTCDRTEVAAEPVGSVLGINSSGDTIYFISEAVLAGAAVEGEDNLYVSHLKGGKWMPTFITTLSPEDELDWATHFTGHGEIDKMTSRVSPNGDFLAFMSDRSLTGYDNHDAVSGEPDQEVFLYDAQSGKLACASCNPTGARPNGLYYSGGLDRALVNNQDIWEGVWVAASVPGWDNIGLSNAIHQTDYLSNEGRLFFNSSDALVPQDSNGLVDVYEYEPDSVGSCGQERGCIGLISSGTSREESIFLDASASGNDVFFITPAQLTSEDDDTAYDVYDAHVCSAAVPCEQASVSPPPCTTGESCKPAPTPQPAIYGAPASATFSGAGNPPRKGGKTTTSRKRSKKRKSATDGGKRRLQQALKQCKRKDAHKQGKQRRCEAQARKSVDGTAKHRASTYVRGGQLADARNGQNRRGR
ncbi:MAG TPA: hypothetical protein VGF95_15730 [Solirubrobacteraceae bacterium]